MHKYKNAVWLRQTRHKTIITARVFPNLPMRSCKLIYQLIRSLKTISSTKSRKISPIHARPYFSYTYIFVSFPHASMRAANLDFGILGVTVWRIRANNWHRYTLHGIQTLQPSNFHRLLDFCNWFLIQQDSNPWFFKNILWTDGVLF